MAQLTLFGARTGNSLRAAIALHEAGLSFDIHPVNLPAGEHFGAPFRRLNPLGQVPVLRIEEKGGEVWSLAQSNAIMLYAAEQAPGQLMPKEPRAAAHAMERFFFFVTDVIAPSYSSFLLRHHGEKNGSSLLHELVIDRIDFVETILANAEFVAGDTFSLADICAYSLISAIHASLDWPALPNVASWMVRMSSREALQRGMHAFD